MYRFRNFARDLQISGPCFIIHVHWWAVGQPKARERGVVPGANHRCPGSSKYFPRIRRLRGDKGRGIRRSSWAQDFCPGASVNHNVTTDNAITLTLSR